MDDAPRIDALRPDDIEGLAEVLRHPAVYAHIEGGVPTMEAFRRHLLRSLAGPGPELPREQWLNFVVRDAGGALAGWLQATAHHGVAEVGFLFGPAHWGRGLGNAGLHWLHAKVERTCGVREFWATATPDNVRSHRLLLRCGYQLAELPTHPVYSHDPGDRVYRRPPGPID